MRSFQTSFGHSSGKRRLRGGVIAFFLCIVLGGGLVPVPAQAIPIAGDYVFVNSPDLSGGFTSTGTTVSAWSFTSDFFGTGTQHLSWNSATDVTNPVLINNTPGYFFTANGDILTGF